MEALHIAEPDDEEEARLKSLDEGLGAVIAEYDMYITNPGKRLLLLQYPNRDPGQPYSQKTGQKPLELRIKPKCGLVEVDIPMNISTNFDRQKALRFGRAIRNSRTLQEGGSYGLSGGLKAGVGPVARTGRSQVKIDEEEPSEDALLENFEEAISKGNVMNKIVLGGRIVPWKDGDPIYMIGAFRGSSIFLSKLDAMVQLRPQFNHLDALSDLDKPALNPRSKSGTENSIDEPQARAVNMTVKSTEGEETDLYGDMGETAKLLKAMREEPWQRLAWIDSEDEHSYKVFNDEMFIHNLGCAPPLVSAMTDAQWLDAISCPRIDPIKQTLGSHNQARPRAEYAGHLSHQNLMNASHGLTRLWLRSDNEILRMRGPDWDV